MDNILKQLLEAEQKAQEIVVHAQKQSEQNLAKAKDELKLAEDRMRLKIDEIKNAYNEKAETRAKNHLHEVERLFQERQAQLVQLANKLHSKAVDEVMDLIINVGDSM